MLLIRLTGFACLSLLLLACTSQEQKLSKELTTFYGHVNTQVQQLGVHIDQGRLSNINLLRQYAYTLGAQKPALKNIATTLGLDATTRGPMYLSLVDRLQDAKAQIPQAVQSLTTAQLLADELRAINTGANSKNFNRALADPINAVAGLSGGLLAPIEHAEGQNNTPEGNALVGNPNYGQWQTNSQGTSFWAWYGQYAFFSSSFPRSANYSDWARNRPASFYNDYGYNTYSSPKQKRQYQATEQKVRKQFAREGKRFQSPYATPKGGSQSNSWNKTASKTQAPGKFQSAYGQSKNTGSSTFKSSYSAPINSKSTYTSRNFGASGSRSFGSGGK